MEDNGLCPIRSSIPRNEISRDCNELNYINKSNDWASIWDVIFAMKVFQTTKKEKNEVKFSPAIAG